MFAVITFKTDGTVRRTEQPKKPSLDELQAAVGGFIQECPYFTKYDGLRGEAYADEEGKLRGKPYNPGATAAWRAALRPGWDPQRTLLVGDVVFVGRVRSEPR